MHQAYCHHSPGKTTAAFVAAVPWQDAVTAPGSTSSTIMLAEQCGL